MLKNILVRKLSSSGRLNLSTNLATFVGVQAQTKVAVCTYEDGKIKIVPLSRVKDSQVVAIVPVDSKYRIVIPKELLEESIEDTYFSEYVFNGDLILQQIEV